MTKLNVHLCKMSVLIDYNEICPKVYTNFVKINNWFCNWNMEKIRM